VIVAALEQMPLIDFSVCQRNIWQIRARSTGLPKTKEWQFGGKQDQLTRWRPNELATRKEWHSSLVGSPVCLYRAG
jgi:hypothetical protein